MSSPASPFSRDDFPSPRTGQALLALARGYQPAAVLTAAAELEIFDALARHPQTATALARRLHCDPRGLTVLLRALVALGLVRHWNHRYALPHPLARYLTAAGEDSILGMIQHQANCLRNWAQLARVVKTGTPAARRPSVRGASHDRTAFIEAMHNISAPVADRVIRAIRPLRVRHLLDVGGASGTWTLAFLRACPSATATLVDLPGVIPLARRRLARAGLSARVALVGADYLRDPLPPGADLAWVSAIVHQHSRAENRALFRTVFTALIPGGRIAIRDILMHPERTRPPAGALFAVNMLVGTPAGGTFTLAELRADLTAAGFRRVRVARRDATMNSIVLAHKPATGARPG